MKIRAKFTGTTGSLGYVNGTDYLLIIHQRDGYLWISNSWPGGGPCPYANWAAFGKNWELLPATVSKADQ